MISERALEAAVQSGLLTKAQVRSLEEIEAGFAASRFEPQDQEKLRFVSGFGDIFVTIGLGLFLGALAYFGSTVARQQLGPEFEMFGAAISVAITSWLLAEFFTRKRRMALPSIVLLVCLANGIFWSVASITPGWKTSEPQALPFILAGAATFVAAVAHYARFHVPITIAAGAAALIAILGGILAAFGNDVFLAVINPLLFVCGIFIFVAAMWFDMRDPRRETRRTDIAFWLHLLAAPLIVHPLVSNLWTEGELTTGAAAGILAIFLGLGAVAVLVNRRAILVSGLSYAGYAFGSLVTQAGFSDNAVPLTLLALGAFVLLLSAGWTRVRTLILNVVPARIRRKLPPDLATPT